MEKNKIDEIKKDFKKIIKIGKSKGFYCDVNFISKEVVTISVDKANTEIDKENDKGAKIRLWDGEKFLESANSSVSFEVLKKEIEKLVETAKKNSKSIDKKLELDFDKEVVEKDFGNLNKEVFSLENVTKEMSEIKDKILNCTDDVANAKCFLSSKTEEHIFVNEKKCLYQNIPIRVFAMIGFVKAKDGSIKDGFESFVDSSVEKVITKAQTKLDDLKIRLEQVKIAKKLRGGKYKVILSPKLTGLLAHESFGHGMEADTIMRERALASSWIGKKIGSDNINIVDFGNIEGKHGQIFFDSDGNLASKTYLVKEGIINEPIADVYSKTRLGYAKSCNSRFESFDHKHYTRMTNTYFEAGKDELNDMIKDVEDGIFVMDSAGGMEDPKGWGVQIQGNFGQKIKNGKLVEEFYDGFALTGFLPDIISNISAVSKEFEIEGGGHCGKGHKEWVRVSEGGPYLKVDEVILG